MAYDTSYLHGQSSPQDLTYPDTPQLLDIAALQYLYGANENGFTGATIGTTVVTSGNNHTYQFTDNTETETVWIGSNVSGTNVFDFSACTGTVTINLNAGSFSSTANAPSSEILFENGVSIGPPPTFAIENVAISYGTIINVGIANNLGATLIADSTAGHNDLLVGGTGNDSFTAGGGRDILVGGGGIDGAVFHDAAASYAISTNGFGGLVVVDGAASPTDGTAILYGDFTSLQFSDKAISETPAVTLSSTGVASVTASHPVISDPSTDYVLTQNSTGTVNVVAAGDSGAVIAALSSSVGDVQFSDTDTIINPGAVTSLTLGQKLADYTLAVNSAGNVVLSANLGFTGASNSFSVLGSNVSLVTLGSALQEISFADQSLLFTPSVNSTVAEVARLYQGTLDRTPDAAGLSYWAGQVASLEAAGDSANSALLAVAPGFVGSAEFIKDYGSTTNSQFVTLLYNNVLDRAPDAGGLSYWVGNLASGAMSQSQVVIGFTESAEFKTDTTYHAAVAAVGSTPATPAGGFVFIT